MSSASVSFSTNFLDWGAEFRLWAVFVSANEAPLLLGR